ncbi:MAG: MFS transporter [Sphingomonas sp.]
MSEDEERKRAGWRIIILLACVLGLELGDLGATSAVSDQLKQAFGISNTQVGLLLAVVSYVTALATLPMGVLVDRFRRKTILVVTIAIWTVAMALSGAATSYGLLLAARLFLGAVMAAAYPCIASMTGDFFKPEARASTYGMILTGELLGAGLGFFISGEISSLLNWRWSFYVMALPSAVLAFAIWRWLPEPDRGGQNWAEAPGSSDGAGGDAMRTVVLGDHVKPRERMVMQRDPEHCSWWWAMRYCLRLPTFRLLVAASALAYSFFAGIRTFGMIYFTAHYGLSRSTVSALIAVPGAGALVGVLLGGRVSERLLSRGRRDARIIVPAIALIASVPPFALAIWTTSVWLGVILLFLGAGFLAAALAPIDAARLDIIHPRLWGRAESGRMAIRSLMEGSTPLLFGAMSGWLGGGESGLMWTSLIMLLMMVAAGIFAFGARSTYPRDVATVEASKDAIKRRNG